MNGEKEDDKNMADVLKSSTTIKDDEAKVDNGMNVNESKRKVQKLEGELSTKETLSIVEEDGPTESRAKKQKREGPGQSDVVGNENMKEGVEDNKDQNEVKPEVKNDPSSSKPNNNQKEKDGAPSTDNDAKDMEIEENTNLSMKSDLEEESSDARVRSEDIEAEEKKTGDCTKDDPNTIANESQALTTDINDVESKQGAQLSSSPDANQTTENDAETKSKDKSSNPYDNLKYIMVRNDGKPESLIKLVALKSLFSRQLPKMPRTYIARLVFDRKHISLVILNDDPATKDTDEEVIGSICYRPFYEMRFAEIAFCAVNASHQVKGYGTKLMNLVKKEGARTGIEFFITYADNYAIGYFKKQGFTKSISMPKGRYQGLIKEYDGGTMMECYVHPSIDFTRIPEMLAAQRKFILSRIKLKALSHKVAYDPLPKNWKPHLEGVSRANESAARALAVPGMIEAGWTIADLMATTGQGKDLDRAKNALKSDLMAILRKVEDQQFAWPFREPVDTDEVKDYLDVIKEPIDLLTIDKRIRKGDHYKSKKMLYADLMLMVNNCKRYNDESSTYVQCAVKLEKLLKSIFVSKWESPIAYEGDPDSTELWFKNFNFRAQIFVISNTPYNNDIFKLFVYRLILYWMGMLIMPFERWS